MPGFDATGPRGMGPGTGWGGGHCGANCRQDCGAGGQQAPCGFGPQARSWGRPRWGHRFICHTGAPCETAGSYEAPGSEAHFLRERQSYLEDELESIRKRLVELDSQI